MSEVKDSVENSFKIIIIGDTSVGKSCLLLRLCNKKVPTNHMITIGVDFFLKRLQLQGKNIKLSIWDTAGQERFKVITTNYYKGSNGVLIVYSVDDLSTFNSIESWISSLKEKSDITNMKIILVGNKCDVKNRQVSYEQGESLAKQYNIPYIETSAFDNINVEKTFNLLAEMCLEQATSNDSNKTQIGNTSDDIMFNRSSHRLSCNNNNNNNKENKKKCCLM